MKGLEIFFPPFATIVLNPELEEYFVTEPEETSISGYNVIVEKYMPENSALFLDKDNSIVAIYLDGRLSFDRPKLKMLEPVFAAFDFLKGK